MVKVPPPDTNGKKLWTLADMEEYYREWDAAYRAHGIAYNDVVEDELLAQFGSWAVTAHGLECLDMCYDIPKERLGKSDIILHMAGKNWVNMYDFVRAYRAAQAHFKFEEQQVEARRLKGPSRKENVGKGKRFKVLRRDGYRCRLCGRTADDGVKLEVDHRIPVARGGTSKMENLWTLCRDCNLGKSARSL